MLFIYIIPKKIQTLVSCDEFLYACVVELCRQSTELVFNTSSLLHHRTYARTVQKLFQVFNEQVKIISGQVRTARRTGKKSVQGKASE
jgi:hypothetical protein